MFDASAASNRSVPSCSESSDDDNLEHVPERVRRSRGGGSTVIEEAAGKSDDDGVFSDPAALGVASINSASATLETTARAIANRTWFEGVYLKTCLP